MKEIGILVVLFCMFVGCAKVSVETKEPIKVDINMRVDVYQHVVKDVESVNDEIYGTPEKNFNALFSLQSVYAAEWSSKAQEAISRRKSRAAKIDDYFREGYIGENKDALLEVKNLPSGSLVSEVQTLVTNENADRQIIYVETAAKNGVSIREASKVFFESDYRRASSGWWFEIYDATSDSYVWRQK